MKMKPFGLLLLVTVIGLSLSSCGCFQQAIRGEEAPPPAPEAEVVPPPAPPPAPAEEPAPPPPVEEAAPAVQPAPAAVLQPIYFDLNKSVIRPDAEETLKANLEWFKQNSDKKVSIQGNCDPRASRKYNHALGLRRANAAKKYLVGLGVDVALLETVSYGKDRPSCQEKNESCWAKERRVDFEPASDTGGATPKASRADRVEARIKDLHSKLKITSAEEEQWNKLAQVMRDNAAAMQPLIEARREKGNMNAVDDLTSYSEIQDAHAAGLKNFIAAFEPLYASMSDDQKKTADQLFTGLGHHKKSKKK